MKSYIPTVEELQHKLVNELRIIYRTATEIAGNEQKLAEERQAARKLWKIRKLLCVKTT